MERFPVTADIVDKLAMIRGRGVVLWSESGRLHYNAPKGALSQRDIDWLRSVKSEVVACLRQATLAFSQQAHWNLFRLGETSTVRQIASATRLHGRLHYDALSRSIRENIRRQDALRTRIVVHQTTPMQIVADSVEFTLCVDDLQSIPQELREAAVLQRIEAHLLEPVDVTADPLFSLRLLQLGSDEHILLVAMEHTISDAFSMGIFLRDLFAGYVQAVQGRSFDLSAVTAQFVEHAATQRATQKAWLDEHRGYWSQHLLRRGERLRFPGDSACTDELRSGRGSVPVRIDRVLKSRLRDWARLNRTTLPMSVFTAYAALVLRWCGAADSIARYQTDGRMTPAVANTIGFYASELYLHTMLRDADTFSDTLNRNMKEYCLAYQHADHYYLAIRQPRLEFTRNAGFNWIPQAQQIDASELEGSPHAIEATAMTVAHPMLRTLELDQEPTLLLYETGDEVVGSLHFSRSGLSIATMQRFTRNLLGFIEALLGSPTRIVRDISLLP